MMFFYYGAPQSKEAGALFLKMGVVLVSSMIFGRNLLQAEDCASGAGKENMDFMMALGQMPLWVLAIVMFFSAGFMGLPESSEAKAAYVKFLMILAFFYFGSFLMRLRYKSM